MARCQWCLFYRVVALPNVFDEYLQYAGSELHLKWRGHLLISFVEIENFRRLESVRVDFDKSSTLLVGPNNSGKSSVIDALAKFLNPGGRTFRVTDFSLDNLRRLNKIGEGWTQDNKEVTPRVAESEQVSLGESEDAFYDLLPTLDIWLSLDEEDLLRMPQAAPSLGTFYGAVGIRLRLEPKNLKDLAESYSTAYRLAQRRVSKGRETNPGAAEPQRGSDETPMATNTNDTSATSESQASITANPKNFVDFLAKRVDGHFEVRGYLLDATRIRGYNPFSSARSGSEAADAQQEVTSPGKSNIQPLGDEPDPYDLAELRAVIQIDEISATRGVTENDSDGKSSRLSALGTEFNKTHFHRTEQLTNNDWRALHATQQAVHARNSLSGQRYQSVFEEISALGYPGGGNPSLVYEEDIPTELDTPRLFFRHKTDPDSGLPNLDESLNGLGYQSLIYMALMLIDFRKRRLMRGSREEEQTDARFATHKGAPAEHNGVAPIHLVLIEEPEVFLHAQVQQVFIKQAMSLLRGEDQTMLPDNLSTQIVVSTHSSHIVQHVDFSTIRYLRRQTNHKQGEFPKSTIANLTSLWQNENITKGFVSRYVRLNHCNMFFADAIILVEGAAERILLPEMVARYKNLNSAYLEILEVGGSHAHRLRELIECLSVPTLVVTDIDAGTGDSKPKKTRPSAEASLVSKNPTLKKWFRDLAAKDKNDLPYLLNLKPIDKIDSSQKVRFAFQIGLKSHPEVIPSTFEDALILANLEVFESKKPPCNSVDDGPEIIFSEFKQLRTIAERLGDNPSVQEKAKELWELLDDKEIGKAELALELLMLPESQGVLKPPQYIKEGLDWLEGVLDERGLLIPEQSTASPDTALEVQPPEWSVPSEGIE